VVAELSAQTKVKRVDRVVFTRLHDECLAIDVASGRLYSLNETGRRVWETLVAPTPIGAVVERLVATFDVDASTCEREVLALVAGLCEADLAEVVDAAG
jgi:hypothetical protein